MKNILTLLLVLGFTPAAHAIVIDLVADQIWPGGSPAHKIRNPLPQDLQNLIPGDEIHFQIKLLDNGIPSTFNADTDQAYSGNGPLFDIGLSITLTGPGALSIRENGAMFHGKLNDTGIDPVVDNAIASIWASGPVTKKFQMPLGIPGGAMDSPWAPWFQNPNIWLIRNIVVTVGDPPGPIFLDLSNDTNGSHYRDGNTGDWILLSESDYGDLFLNIPEPAAITFLALGAVTMIYRRKRSHF